MKQTAAAVLLLLVILAALALSRVFVLLLEGTWERWAYFGLGVLAGWAMVAGVGWFVVDDAMRKGEL